MPTSTTVRKVNTLAAAVIAVLLLTRVGGRDSPRAEHPSQDPFHGKRIAMVRDQIEARGITDPATITAMRRVPRHEFVPSDRTDEAYQDHPLPIGYGQTISQPYIVGLMTELLQLTRVDRVLEVGSGSGYQAAVLAEIVDSVYTIEIIEDLARTSRARLDAIIVTAAAEHIPPPLISQLKDGGRMVIPVGHPFFVQNLVLVEKHDGSISTRSLIPVRFVPLTRSK
jgi:protein-L-isoaspartate(D-aspartate) O-methyltransferase